MVSFFRRFIRHYPMQSFLILFNTGVFAWLQTLGQAISQRFGVSGEAIWSSVPDWLRSLSQYSVNGVQRFFNSAGFGWLVVSMLLTLLMTFLRGLLRMILLIVLIFVGLWLIYRYYDVWSAFIS